MEGAYYPKVGVIGVGAVGRQICHAVDSGQVDADLTAVFDAREERVQQLLYQLKRVTRSMTLVGLVSSADLVVEATTPQAAGDMVMAALNGGKDVLVTNPGALLANEVLVRLAQERGVTIYLPSLELAGMDALKVAAQGRVDSCLLTVTAHPRCLEGSAALGGQNVQGQEVDLFQGTAADAARAFAPLANQLAVAILGGLGPTRTTVRVRADDRLTRATFQLDVAGECGRLLAWMDSQPDPLSPDDSKMVALSAISALRNIFNTVRVI